MNYSLLTTRINDYSVAREKAFGWSQVSNKCAMLGIKKSEVVEIQRLPIKFGVQDEDTIMLFNG